MAKKPKTTKITNDWGQLTIILNNDYENQLRGLHCFVSDSEENILNWLSQFNEVPVGNGSPMMESFSFYKFNSTKDV